ncbi:MAG TPA: SDR family NAD(P)-dependent oxidoreductase [Candidatus Sulfotelmatobacter sp.]|nr:SDR family NAD(P)-dependent oxidoreductase [Candidatus Sulfotelmatobacter sp.]
MKGIVIVTGANFRESKRLFKNTDKSLLVEHEGKRLKLNAGAATAIVLNQADYLVYMTGASLENLEIIGKQLKGEFYFKEVDLLDKNAVKKLAESIKNLKDKTGLDVHIVHYGGASETNVPLPRNTIYLDPWETPSEAISPMIDYNCVTWLNLMQALKEVTSTQKITKNIVISAVAAIRTGRFFLLDAIQKGAVHSMARTLAIDLTKENMFITEIMPGITDTGFYDTDETLDATMQISKEYGYEYPSRDDLPVFPAQRIADSIKFVLDTPAHIREISLIPFGQYPQLGA